LQATLVFGEVKTLAEAAAGRLRRVPRGVHLCFGYRSHVDGTAATYHKASSALVGGASIILALTFFGLIHPDARSGQAAIECNRRFYLVVLAVELPVFTLALISLRYFRYAFWLGWVANLIFTLWLAAVLVWLEFFWHW
jgi:hypothetical protein